MTPTNPTLDEMLKWAAELCGLIMDDSPYMDTSSHLRDSTHE